MIILRALGFALPIVALLGGCTTVERNQVALGMCSRTTWCTATEQPQEANGPPQVRAMEGRKREKVLNSQK